MVFPDRGMWRKVRTAGGPMIFSGPIQPPLLGAAIQSAKIHLSDELPRLQAALRERVELFTDLADEFLLPLASRDVTPIRYIPLGLPAVPHDVIQHVMADGYYVNIGMFPAVPIKRSGVRATLTLHHTLDDVRDLVESLARHIPAALERGGEAAQRHHAKVAGAQTVSPGRPTPSSAISRRSPLSPCLRSRTVTAPCRSPGKACFSAFVTASFTISPTGTACAACRLIRSAQARTATGRPSARVERRSVQSPSRKPRISTVSRRPPPRADAAGRAGVQGRATAPPRPPAPRGRSRPRRACLRRGEDRPPPASCS